MKRCELIKTLAIVPIGGSEEEQKQLIKSLFRKSNNTNYKSRYTKEDINELDRLHLENEAYLVFG